MTTKVSNSKAEPKPAAIFSPHKFETKITTAHKTPVILISQLAFEKMYHLVDLADEEIGWLGTVSEIDGGYYIEDIYLIEQEVHSTETDMTINGLATLGTQLLMEGRDEEYSKLRLWGHSHVRMGVNPSVTDDNTMVQLGEAEIPWAIRIICNKSGDLKCWVYKYDAGVKYSDVPWQVHSPMNNDLREQLKTEIDEKVTTKSWSNTTNYPGGYNSGYWDGSCYKSYKSAQKADNPKQYALDKQKGAKTSETAEPELPRLEELDWSFKKGLEADNVKNFIAFMEHYHNWTAINLSSLEGHFLLALMEQEEERVVMYHDACFSDADKSTDQESFVDYTQPAYKAKDKKSSSKSSKKGSEDEIVRIKVGNA